MKEALDPWEEKAKAKLETFRKEVDVDEQKVASFFSRLENEGEIKASNTNKYGWLKIAASVLVIISAFGIVYRVNNVTVSTLKGEQLTVQLPDQSRVQLRYASSLRYNKLIWMFNRDVAFAGEAYFQVESGSSFTVNSDIGKTSVLGTEFNVLARGDSYEVKCFEGRVNVETAYHTYELSAGDALNYEQGAEPEAFRFSQENPNWHVGEVYFENRPIAEVIEELKNTFGIQIETTDTSLDNLRYTGFFPTNDLDMALRLVFDPLSLEATFKEGKTVWISGKSD